MAKCISAKWYASIEYFTQVTIFTELFIVIIFIQDLQNRKSCKVIKIYLAEMSQLMHLTNSAKLHMLVITYQMQREPVLKKTL